MTDLILKVKRLHPGAYLPTRAHESDAGLDLYTPVAFTLSSATPVVLGLGISVEIPPGWYGQIRERSGLAACGVAVGGGVIDQIYRKEWRVVLRLHGDGAHKFRAGEKVAQVTFHEVPSVLIQEFTELAPSDRGGFGSTGR